jgi:hypothetical protein
MGLPATLENAGASAMSSSYSTDVPLLAGETIDFAVGFGANNNFNFDNTRLSATISPVPVPAAALLGWLGLGTAGWFLRRRGSLRSDADHRTVTPKQDACAIARYLDIIQSARVRNHAR